jgi:hypothetical protein
MQRVNGIGGVFFRSQDPNGLARWYRDNLGLQAFSDEVDETWWQAGGPTVWAPFPADTDYFGLLRGAPVVEPGAERKRDDQDPDRPHDR